MEQWGERILPTQRYFPASATADRWLNSSTVEVNGANIGKINARLLSDGRIEFAFTPTDGEQILPSSRYFPAGLMHDRWLKSTKITITRTAQPAGPPLGSFRAISAGSDHTCGLRDTGAIECWGRNSSGQINTPSGSFRAISAGSDHTCGLRDTGAIECWGRNSSGQINTPSGSFRAISAGSHHTCGLRDDGAIVCWGNNDERQSDAPSGSFKTVSAGYEHTCGLRSDGSFECWGDNDDRRSTPPIR